MISMRSYNAKRREFETIENVAAVVSNPDALGELEDTCQSTEVISLTYNDVTEAKAADEIAHAISELGDLPFVESAVERKNARGQIFWTIQIRKTERVNAQNGHSVAEAIRAAVRARKAQ